MKKNELKQVLKPLIKECIKECIFEDGVLSGIITEVVSGLETRRVVTEGVTIQAKQDDEDQKQKELEEKYERNRQERIKRLNEAGSAEVDIFEGTKAIPGNSSPGNPMAGVASDDAGVDIGGILNLAGNKWKQLI